MSTLPTLLMAHSAFAFLLDTMWIVGLLYSYCILYSWLPGLIWCPSVRVLVGVPTLVLVDEENKVISSNARFVVASDIEGKVWMSFLLLLRWNANWALFSAVCFIVGLRLVSRVKSEVFCPTCIHRYIQSLDNVHNSQVPGLSSTPSLSPLLTWESVF